MKASFVRLILAAVAVAMYLTRGIDWYSSLPASSAGAGDAR